MRGLSDERVQVVFAPLTVLEGDAIGVFDGDVGFIFADDPAFVIACDEPLGDFVEVELAGAHLRPRLRAVAGVVLVVNVVHEVLEFVEGGDDVHAAANDVTDVGGPAGDFGVEAGEDDVVIFLGANEGGWRAVGVVGALEAGVVGALGDGVDVAGDVEATFLEVVGAAAGEGDGAEHGAGEVLQEVDGEIGGGAFVGGFFFAIPSADEGETGELDIVLLEGVSEADGVAEVAEPVFAAAEGALGDFEDHGFDAGEAGLARDFDHVIEFVVVAFAGALHEPGVDL